MRGDGSIYQRASDQRWIVAIEEPRVRGEKRQRRVMSATSREAAEAKLEQYRQENPAPHRFATRKEALENGRTMGQHTRAEWRDKLRAANCVCAYCGEETNVYNLEKDHAVPLTRGGSDGIDNIAVTCRPCNRKKRDMTADEYMEWLARSG